MVLFFDLVFMAVLCKFIGGELRYYFGFTSDKDGVKYVKELKNNFMCFIVWEVVCWV